MNSNYTVENFEKWLNADKSRKRGLWLWSSVIGKVKSDSDLFNALATGQDQGGWNISDPEFRKQYQFEDYYQVFVEWKKELDAENDDEIEKQNEEEKKKIEELNGIQGGLEEEPKNNREENSGYGGTIIIITIILMLVGVFYFWIRSYL